MNSVLDKKKISQVVDNTKKLVKVFNNFKVKLAPKPKQIPNNELENLKIELNSILTEKEVRQANFENATGKDYVDIAIAELTAIENKYTTILRQIKKLS